MILWTQKIYSKRWHHPGMQLFYVSPMMFIVCRIENNFHIWKIDGRETKQKETWKKIKSRTMKNNINKQIKIMLANFFEYVSCRIVECVYADEVLNFYSFFFFFLVLFYMWNNFLWEHFKNQSKYFNLILYIINL